MDSLMLDAPAVGEQKLTTEIALLGTPVTALSVFGTAGGADDVLAKLKKAARAEPRDISTEKGRKALASLALKIAKSKTALDEMGKDLVADLKKQTGAIDVERKRIRDDLDDLKVEIRKPLTDWEDADEKRIEAYEAALVGIRDWGVVDASVTTDQIRERITILEAAGGREWQEFAQRATDVTAKAIADLTATITAREAHEAEQVELARQKAEQDERDRQEQLRLQAEREKQIAVEAAATAKREAEKRAADEAAETARKAKEVSDAAEAERAKLAREKQDAIDAAARAEKQRKQDVLDASAAREARERQIEIDKAAATAKAQRDKDAAIEAERQRAADAKAAEDAATEKREKNKRHAAKIHNAIKAELIDFGLSESKAMLLIVKIARGEIPRTSISY